MKDFTVYKINKKPITVDYEIVLEDCIIETLEGNKEAKQGDVLITGVSGEQYPIEFDKFNSTYRAMPDGKATYVVNKPRFCINVPSTMPKGSLWLNNQEWLVSPLDKIVQFEEDSIDIFIVSSDIFDKTYDVISEATKAEEKQFSEAFMKACFNNE